MKFSQRLRALFGRTPQPPRIQARRFQAAQMDRLTAGWFATEQSINEELRGDLNAIRRRGRELRKNNDYAKKFTGMVEDNIIGPLGITYQARVMNKPGEPDELANNAIESAWDRWKRVADVTGKQHFDDMCRTMVGGLTSDGEFLVREVIGPDAGNEFNYALQLIDVDRIDTTYNVAAATPGGNAIIMGIEVTQYRQPVAVHLFAGHPSDGQHSNRTRVRVPLDGMIHAFKVEYPDQLRGIPWMAPGMLSLHHLGSFKLAALLAAEHGANHYGFFTTPDGEAPIGQQDAETQEQISTSQPGVYDTLPTGVQFTPHESKYPNDVFGPFVKTTGQRIASGWRVSYNSLFNDLEGVNFSSIRSGTLEDRDRWRGDQRWFINVLLERIHPNWMRQAMLASAITMPNGSALPLAKLSKFMAHEWQPRSWDWVDPEKDINAIVTAINAGVLTPQAAAAMRGTDYFDNITQIAAAQKLAATNGVTLTAYLPKGAAAAAAQQPPAPPPK